MAIIYQKFISRGDLKKNPNVLYLMGDNDARKGLGGQAKEMRGEPNAVGIRTKVSPGRESSDYWHDKNFESNTSKIESDLIRVKTHLRQGGIVVIPSDGLGTGLSEMSRRCPKTFYMLQQSLESLELIKPIK